MSLIKQRGFVSDQSGRNQNTLHALAEAIVCKSIKGSGHGF